jgi:4-amino-4-deoxy-L-arabinose transferase-like glycosyltransferase
VVSPRQSTATSYALAAVPVFGLALLLYVRTLLPDVGLWDTAEFQTIGSVLGIAHPTGYPTYTLLAWLASVLLAPFGNEAYRADLLSALLMAGAAALLAVRAVQATQRWPIGVLAGISFAMTPVAWQWGQRADPHALHAFLAALMLVLLACWAGANERDPRAAAWWLLSAAAVFGLSLGNHALTLLLAPGIAAYVLLVAPRLLWQRWRLVLTAAAVIALTTIAVYLYLPLRSAMDPPLDYADPETWGAFWYVVLGEQFQGSFGPLPAAGEVLAGISGQLAHDFGVVWLVAVAGAVVGLLRHPRLALLTLLWFACTWLFAIGYPNAAIERYFLVPLLVAALWLAFAVEAAWEALRGLQRWNASGRAVGLARVALVSVLVLAVVIPAAARYEEMDASDDTWGREIVEATFATLEPDAVVLSWWSFSTPLWYGRWVEDRRPDVTIIDDRDILDDGFGNVEVAIEHFLGDRPVYLIRLERDLEALRARYVLQPVPGMPLDLQRVVARKAE